MFQPMVSGSVSKLAALCIGAALACLAWPSLSAPAYRATDLGTLGGTTSVGFGINAAGDVAGWSTAPVLSRAFLYSGGTMTNLGAPGSGPAPMSLGRAVNDALQVTGWATDCGPNFCVWRTFLYTGGGMSLLPPTVTAASTFGYGINMGGQIVGEIQGTIAGSRKYALIYDRNGSTYTVLGTLGGPASSGYGINDSGQATGVADTTGNASHAFVYAAGTMRDLGTLGGTNSTGYAINASGQVTGSSDITGDAAKHAFIYSAGRMRDLGTLGGTSSAGYGINASGQVVGTAALGGNGPAHAFLYSAGLMYDLNVLVLSGLGNFTLVEARAINDRGQIVANTCDQIVTVGCRTFRLDPVPQPVSPEQVPALSNIALIATVVLLLAAGLLHRMRRARGSGRGKR